MYLYNDIIKAFVVFTECIKMRFLKVLLARACIPLCYIHILKFESGQLLPSDVIFLHVLMALTIVWISDIATKSPRLQVRNFSRIFSGTSLICSMYLALNWTHFFFVEGHEARKYILLDFGFPCLDLQYLFKWTCYELWCVAFFIYRYLKHLGAGPVRIIYYLVYLAMHAVVVVFIMEFITLSFATQFYFALKDNFYYTFDANTSDAYPRGYLDPLVLDTGLYDKDTMTTEFYTCPPDINGTCDLTWGRKSDEDAKFPFKHNMIYRYVGEDVKMTCEYRLKLGSVPEAEEHSTVWIFNESVIANSSRHFVYNSYIQVGESVDVRSTLKVKFLKDSEFGEYVCSSNLKITYVIDNQGYLAEKYAITKFTIQVFDLIEIKVKLKLIYRVVGNIITSENYFWYHSDDDVIDMSIVYTVNDRPVDEVCHGFQSQTCSLGATILRNFIRVGAQNIYWDGSVEFPFIEIGEIPGFGLKRGIVYFCLCSSGYGIHRISFIRKVYSGLTKKYKNEEILHPFVFIVLPLSTISLFRFYDDTHLYTKIEKLVEDENHFDIIEDAVDDLIGFISANEEKVLTLANAIQVIIFITCGIFFYILTLVVTNIYLGLFIVYVPHRVFMPYYTLPGTEHIPAIEAEQYGIYISYSDEEYTFVTETLLPVFENDCDIRVCFPDRDFPQNRSIFNTFVDRIRKCRKIIVVLSRAYMAEPLCRNLQLDHIILPLIYQELRTSRDILIIKYEEGIVLPEPLKWNNQIQVYPWFQQLPVHVKLRTMKKWALSGHI